jgi:hypothetical protein
MSVISPEKLLAIVWARDDAATEAVAVALGHHDLTMPSRALSNPGRTRVEPRSNPGRTRPEKAVRPSRGVHLGWRILGELPRWPQAENELRGLARVSVLNAGRDPA